jgi:hypothetical protein
MGAGTVEGMDATGLTKQMFSRASIEGIGAEGVCSLQERESFRGNNQMQKSLFLANGTITLDRFVLVNPNSKSHGSAVTPPLVNVDLSIHKRFSPAISSNLKVTRI